MSAPADCTCVVKNELLHDPTCPVADRIRAAVREDEPLTLMGIANVLFPNSHTMTREERRAFEASVWADLEPVEFADDDEPMSALGDGDPPTILDALAAEALASHARGETQPMETLTADAPSREGVEEAVAYSLANYDPAGSCVTWTENFLAREVASLRAENERLRVRLAGKEVDALWREAFGSDAVTPPKAEP